MSSIPFGKQLGRADVINHRLITIFQSATIVKDDMEWVYTYYGLDTGAVFFLHSHGGTFRVEDPGLDCTPQDYPELRSVINQRIIGVLMQGANSESSLDSPYLVMENGSLVTDVLGYPVGPAYAGLHIYKAGEIDQSLMIDFFSLPSDS